MKSAEKSSQETASAASQSFAFYSPECIGSKYRFSRAQCGNLRSCRLQ